MKRIVLASNNPGKLRELQDMLAPLGLELLPQGALGIPEAEEPHRTFLENALAKARHASRASGLPALADDAGLCVDAFGGLPGVDTAYYATQFGYPKGDDHNVTALLQQMKDIGNRRAAMVSTLVALRSADDPEPLIAHGRWAGEIGHVPRGSGGFGYDPLFYSPEFGMTFAEAGVGSKNHLSHRARAMQAIKPRLLEYLRSL